MKLNGIGPKWNDKRKSLITFWMICMSNSRPSLLILYISQVEDVDDDDDDMPIGTSMRRSFSDSHLETLKEVPLGGRPP